MRKVAYGTLILILYITFILTPGWAQSTGPKMVLKENHFDAKEVEDGEVIEHAFPVQNTGDLPLQILKVRPG